MTTLIELNNQVAKAWAVVNATNAAFVAAAAYAHDAVIKDAADAEEAINFAINAGDFAYAATIARRAAVRAASEAADIAADRVARGVALLRRAAI